MAKLATKEVEREVISKVKVKEYTLTLNEAEAIALRWVAGSCTGSVEKSARGIMDRIFYEFKDAGVPDYYGKSTGSLFFQDDPELLKKDV